MSVYYMDFDGPDEVMGCLDLPRPNGAGDSSRTASATDSWDLGLGYDGAIDAYCGGWSEGAHKAYELAEQLRPKPVSRRRTMKRSVAGGVPNVPAYLAGQPDAMFTTAYKTAVNRPFVHLYMPIGYLAGVDGGTAFDRGCALVAVADALESAGCRVKITLMRVTEMPNGGRLCIRILGKDFGDALDVDQLIFTAAHPAMYRRLCFALQERSEHEHVQRSSAGGYGSTCPPVATDDCEHDGLVINVMFPTLTPRQNGRKPEEFLTAMVGALPEELATEITGE